MHAVDNNVEKEVFLQTLGEISSEGTLTISIIIANADKI